MCPQLVDFNADGSLDLVMGTFEGVAFLVPGSKNGFQEPQRILDADGKTILLSSFWNHDTKKWENADRSPKGQKYPEDHCISVVAVDWDKDGDLDLLLGAKEGGLYLRRNDGLPGKPKFVTTNERIMTNSQPIMVPGGLTAPRLVDWNNDGLFDLACGSFNGGVYLYLNAGKPGQPAFGAAEVLIPPAEEKGGAEPKRPTEGCYADVVDYDGDGKLDLLVGGYSTWTPEQKKLSDAEAKEADELVKKINTLRTDLGKIYHKAQEKAKGDDKEITKQYQELAKSDEFKKIQKELRTADRRHDELRPKPKREAFVWLYRQM
jgi:hypothetical protein